MPEQQGPESGSEKGHARTFERDALDQWADEHGRARIQRADRQPQDGPSPDDVQTAQYPTAAPGEVPGPANDGNTQELPTAEEPDQQHG